METRKKTYLFLIILLTVFNFFFWGEKLGLNLFIFLSLCSAAVILTNESNRKSKNIIITLLAVLYSAAMVVVNNSGFSKFAAISIFIVFTGFAHQKELKSVFGALLTAIPSFIIFPYNIIEEIRHLSKQYKPVRTVLKVSKLALLPLMFFTVFYAIYAYSNPMFNSYSVTFWDKVGEYLYDIFVNYPLLRFIFIFFGLFLIMGVLYNRNIKIFSTMDNAFLDLLHRDKENKVYSRVNPQKSESVFYKMFSYRFKFNTLKFEYKMGMIFIIMMNALLLILNIIDINFTWLGFDAAKVDNLAYYVHNGTYLLIFSILLSMAILLYFFRGNQNFYPKSRLLKYGAYFWIIQNAVMAVSVALRNLYYIEYYYALSYKRIGVMIFLLLTFAGLVTMFIKIYKKRTTYYLLKVNAWAAFVVLLLMCSFSWDRAIAEFNFSNPDKSAIDIEYLLLLSDDTLPVLDKYRGVLDRNYYKYRNRWYSEDEQNGLKEYYLKVNRFLSEQQNYSWLSWNLPDCSTMRYYTENGLPYKDWEIRDYNPEHKEIIAVPKTQ
jgi:hypothetical protein